MDRMQGSSSSDPQEGKTKNSARGNRHYDKMETRHLHNYLLLPPRRWKLFLKTLVNFQHVTWSHVPEHFIFYLN
jgi:hypothetical protein